MLFGSRVEWPVVERTTRMGVPVAPTRCTSWMRCTMHALHALKEYINIIHSKDFIIDWFCQLEKLCIWKEPGLAISSSQRNQGSWSVYSYATVSCTDCMSDLTQSRGFTQLASCPLSSMRDGRLLWGHGAGHRPPSNTIVIIKSSWVTKDGQPNMVIIGGHYIGCIDFINI